MNSFKKLFYLVSIFLFFSFTITYYFTKQTDNILKIKDLDIQSKLEKKISSLPYLENDTGNIIDFDNTVNNLDNKRKKRKFWELLKSK
tara:strand:- start:212 stop:475 length:264 start_codon:yes stop_codon:yes gene_type:complete